MLDVSDVQINSLKITVYLINFMLLNDELFMSDQVNYHIVKVIFFYFLM